MMKLENIIEICVGIDIAILGIAYPIIVDKISNIGEKYSSEYLSELFSKEIPQLTISLTIRRKKFSLTLFKLTLYVTIFSFLFLICKCKPWFGWDNWFINNSAKIIILLLTALTTIFFFIWLDKVSLYNGKSTTLLKRLVIKYPKLKNDTEIKQYYLKSINEFTLYAIAKQDEHLQGSLLDFYANEFSEIRRKHDKSKPLVYPIDLYFLINKLNYELVNNQNKKLQAIEHRAISGVWLLGEFEDIIISEETYNWLWRNLYVICDNEKFIMMYWANVSQYFDFRLKRIYPEYDRSEIIRSGEVKASNIEEIEKREKERNRFLELHYALGGLLLYREQYKAIRYMMEYTQSLPPRYALIPESMTSIFYWFEYFRNEFKNRDVPIDYKYYFPGLDNLGNRGQINYWICSYLTVLFTRQYTLTPHLVFQNFTGLPDLPNDIIELTNWLESASYFEQCLNDFLQKTTLLKELGLKDTVEVKEDEIKQFPTRLKEAINNKIGDKKLSAELSNAKIETFENTSNEIISNAFDDYSSVVNKSSTEPQDSDLKIPIRGGATLMTKSAFTEGDIPHLNYDSVFAEQIAKNNIRRLIPNSFASASTKKYLLNPDNLFMGLEKIVQNNKDIIIVGVNLNYQTETLLSNSRFHSLIAYIPALRPMQDVLFVLNRKDLPILVFKDLKENEVNEYKVKLINADIKLYASVIDINKEGNKVFKDRWGIKEGPEESDVKVEIAIIFLADINWKKERKVVQINIASQYTEQGIQSDISEVEEL